MNKRSSLLLIAVFLAVQVLSILHVSAFGFEQHKHNGHLCEIFLHSEKTKYADMPASISLPIIPVSEVRLQNFTSVILSKQIYKGAFARAPPSSLPA